VLRARSSVLGFVIALLISVIAPIGPVSIVAAAECTLRIGPGVPPPLTAPHGIPGFHAFYWGQSGYPTLCPGQTARMVVAYWNSGSFGWMTGPGTAAFVGTYNPEPGQDRPSIVGGEGVEGGPNTRWPGYNRPAHPVSYVGPDQIAWFQFTVRAPQKPGTYRLHVRPLIETVEWMEDFGVYWEITVVPASPPQRVTVATVDRNADLFTVGGATYRYDSNDAFEYGDGLITQDQFEQLLSAGDVADMRYEPTAAGVSSFNIVADLGYAPPTVNAQVGSFDGGDTRNDIKVDVVPPASNVFNSYPTQRALVPANTTVCEATSGAYDRFGNRPESFTELNVATGTYCYRAGAHNEIAQWTAFGYSAPIRMPVVPERG
jgi:hypothetical protein